MFLLQHSSQAVSIISTWVRQQREGKAQPCFTAALLSDADTTDTPDLDEIFMGLTGTAYVGKKHSFYSTDCVTDWAHTAGSDTARPKISCTVYG